MQDFFSKLAQLNVSEQAALSLIITAVGVFFSSIYTFITLFLWVSTRKSVQLTSRMVDQLAKQVDHQLALSYTTSEHNIVDSHRELFLSILQNKELCESFARESRISTGQLQNNILGTLLINHCSALFRYHLNHIISDDHLENFIKDAKDMFSLPFLNERWKIVKEFHSEEFRKFVDNILLSDKDLEYKDEFSKLFSRAPKVELIKSAR